MADLPKLSKSAKAAAEHATGFTVPIYNIWKQQEKAARESGTSWKPGNSEVACGGSPTYSTGNDLHFYRYFGTGQVREVVEGENEAHIRSASTRIIRERAEELAEMFNRTVERLKRRKYREGKRKNDIWSIWPKPRNYPW